ncbi:DUF262 domain-containing protein [Staphylococcus epidermidis]
MSFKTENRTISTIFQRSAEYRVPRYQRDYVWKENNWSELLTDLTFTINTDSNTTWSHFLGTIVLNDKNNTLGSSKDPGVAYYEIIDGQQRLTTIYIIFAVIVKHLNSINTEESIKRAKFVRNTFLTTLKSNYETISKINNPDIQKSIHLILDFINKGSSIEITKTNNKLYDVFNYFLSYISNKTFEETDVFLNKLLKINIVEIISEEEEEIYNIFEVLNARGQKLKQMELLKNHIMKYVQPRTDNFIDHSKNKWNDIIKITDNLSDIDSLINHFSKCYIKKRAENINSVYKLIKEEVNIENLSNLLDDLHDFAKSYMIVNEVEKPDSTIEYFNIKRNQQIRSLLAAINLLHRKQIIKENTEDLAFKNIRNFFFIFNGMRQTSNRTDKIIGHTSYSIYHCRTETEFKITMTDFFLKMNKYINKSKFLNIIKNNSSFKFSNKDNSLKKNNKLVKYTLVHYAQFFQKDSNIHYKDMSIEHIISDDGSNENSSIGNLTVVSPELNSNDLANKDIADKLSILNKKSSIKVNHLIKDYYNIEKNHFNANKRENDIFEFLYDDIFPFNPYIYNINEENVKTYSENYDIVESDEELLELLLKKGINFNVFLENDPSYQEQYNRYIEMKQK